MAITKNRQSEESIVNMAMVAFPDKKIATIKELTEGISDAWDYLKAYAIDCLQTCFLFCFIGYYNGIGKTKFVMMQGICGAFLVRIPVAFLMQHFGNGSLFQIGLAIPCSTILQIIMCFVAYIYFGKKKTENTLQI